MVFRAQYYLRTVTSCFYKKESAIHTAGTRHSSGTRAQMNSEVDIAASAMCLAAFVATVLLYTASYVGAETAVHGISREDVLTAARGWRDSRRRNGGGVAIVAASAFAPEGIPYVVQTVTDVEGWGTVVIGETANGGGRIYAATANATHGGTHLTLHHHASAQKYYAQSTAVGTTSAVRDTRLLPDEEEPIDQQPRRARQSPSSCNPTQYTDRATGRTVLRVGVLHTPEVLATDYYDGSSESVRAEVAVAVAAGNAEAFPHSGVDLKIELCVNGPLPTGSPSLERSSPRTTLSAFATSRAVEAARVANQCDTMVLFATLSALGNRACGIGYLPGEHAVVAADCFVDNYSFLHEIGHNIGACHGPPSRSCANAANGYGDATNDFRTILAYRAICGGGSGNCTRVPRYSNKEGAFAWKGASIGNGHSSNADIINTNKAILAGRSC